MAGNTSDAMHTLTVKVPPGLHAKLTALARKRRSTKSAVVREAIERIIAAPEGARAMTAFDLVADLAGSVEGPSDLSTNPKYMEEFGLDRAQIARLKK
mgnify:CR=1 FL=1